ncbi:MAG: hypothetical protein IPF42_07095 [Candidatus Microthrix sp.]|nr:hypothetical protein [Candidatus Microthrix sp.]
MFLSARLAISVVIGGALLIPAASCGGDSGREVTPLAEAEAEATTSTTAVSGDSGTAASTASEPSKASAAEPPDTRGSSDPTETTVTPTSAPSAERFADGTVVSAGGYEAKTPAVARGLLLEPEWTDEQQEAADVIHEYLDAMITTVTDTKPDTTIPTSMTDLERPDLLGQVEPLFESHVRVQRLTDQGSYYAYPRNSEGAFWIDDISPAANERIQISLCEYNDYESRSAKTDETKNDGVSSAFWEAQLVPTPEGLRFTAMILQNARNGKTGCASNL